MTRKDDARRYRSNRQDEVDSAHVYRAMAAAERQPELAEVYRRLAATEERHARFWEEQLRAAGEEPEPARPSGRARVLAWLARRFGAPAVLPTIASLEQADRGMYDRQPESRATPLPADERSHARVLRSITGTGGRGLEGRTLARLEGRHRTFGGNALRAAVLGANDGLVSNLSLVMGVAGASLSATTILIAGLAGLLAGAVSMALGEWISVQSSRELYQREIEVEAEEIRAFPEEEEEELVLIYRAKGVPEDQARALATQLMAEPATALDTLAREELGIEPAERGGSPWTAAGASFALFAAGAVVPAFPYAFLSGAGAVGLSIGASALALFLVGAGISLVTGRGIARSGLRQLAVGLAAAGVTFGIGRLIGVAVTG